MHANRRKATLLVAVAATLLLSSILASAQTITLTLSTRWGGEEEIARANLLAEIIADFERRHPNVKVDVIGGQREDELIVRTAGGTAPDLFQDTIDAVMIPARHGLLMPLNNLVAQDGFDLDAFFPLTLENASLSGSLYALPTTWGATAVAVNKNIWGEAGLPFPQANWTWNDWLTYGRRVTKDTDGDGTPNIWAFRNVFNPGDWAFELITSNGGYWVSDDFSQWGGQSPAVIRSLEFMEQAVNTYRIVPRPSEASTVGASGGVGFRNWMSGTMFAMEPAGPWDLVDFEAIEFDWDVVQFPLNPETGRRGARLSSEAWSIHRDTQHPREAWELLKAITSAEYQAKMSDAGIGIPSRRQVAIDVYLGRPSDVNIAEFVQASEYMRLPRYFMIPGEATSQIVQAYRRIMDGEVEPIVAMEQITPALEAAISDLSTIKRAPRIPAPGRTLAPRLGCTGFATGATERPVPRRGRRGRPKGPATRTDPPP